MTVLLVSKRVPSTMPRPSVICFTLILTKLFVKSTTSLSTVGSGVGAFKKKMHFKKNLTHFFFFQKLPWQVLEEVVSNSCRETQILIHSFCWFGPIWWELYRAWQQFCWEYRHLQKHDEMIIFLVKPQSAVLDSVN